MGISLDASLVYDIAAVNGDASRQNASVGSVRDLADALLVARAQRGDFFAFEELVRRHRNDVFRLAYHFVRDREEAWDIAQEVFIKAYNSLGRFRGEAHFRTWLLRIAANHSKDVLKRRRVATVGFDDVVREEDARSSGLEPDQAIEAQELGKAIEAALRELPHKHRTAFILREFEGLSYEEIAQVMHCRLGTVMSRLHHARRKLQRSLIHMGVAPADQGKEDRTHG